MNWSTVNFVGSNPARMQINSDLAAFKHLNISKSDGARIAIDEESTKNIVIRGNLTVNPGAVLRNSCDYDVVLYGNLSSSGGLIFENCALRMLNRTGNQSISLSGANRLYSLVIDSSYEVSLHSNLPLHGSMLIENGTFNAGNNVITVYGDWNNDAGLGSLIGNGHKVVFAGSYNADCDETGFDILELNKINGAELRVPPGATLACQSYDWSSGALRVLEQCPVHRR
ncbi:MAG: hypothetical protein LRZ88_07860 [Candidatus Cloacimonetes bacterium]|nr:hypothetical protein [Candidatus Cloacimonadota bacterium]